MKKNIPIGLMFILLAIYLISSEMGYTPVISVGKVLVTAACLVIAVNSILSRSFIQMMLAFWLIFVVLKDYIAGFFPEVSGISNWTAVLVAMLLGIGLKFIFKGGSKKVAFTWSNENQRGFYDMDEDTASVSEDEVFLKNTFGSSGRYINSEEFKKGNFENAFGNMNIYMNNSVISPEGAEIVLEVSFGNLNLYLPAGCRVNLSDESLFGAVDIIGTEVESLNSPIVNIRGEVAFGKVNIYL